MKGVFEMKTKCPMKLLLQELTDGYPTKGQESFHECCAIMCMKLLSETHDPLELIEAIRKEFEKHT